MLKDVANWQIGNQFWGQIAYPISSFITVAFQIGLGYRNADFRRLNGNDPLYIWKKSGELPSSKITRSNVCSRHQSVLGL